VWGKKKEKRVRKLTSGGNNGPTRLQKKMKKIDAGEQKHTIGKQSRNENRYTAKKGTEGDIDKSSAREDL